MKVISTRIPEWVGHQFLQKWHDRPNRARRSIKRGSDVFDAGGRRFFLEGGTTSEIRTTPIRFGSIIGRRNKHAPVTAG